MDEILNLAVLGELNGDDVEDVVVHELLVPGRRPAVRRDFHGRLNLDALTREECKLYFRFEAEHIRSLVQTLGIPQEVVTPNHRTSGKYSNYLINAMDHENLVLTIYLRRLAYPNRLSDLEQLFGLAASGLSEIANTVMSIIDENKGHLLTNLRSLRWLNEDKMRLYAQVIAEKGAPLQNYWAFIDGTARAICRPYLNQQEYYSGHKRHHCVKYQSVLCPDGIIASLIGAYPGRRHDAGILRESNLYAQLEEVCTFGDNQAYVIYGDPAYPLRELLLCPYSAVNITEEQQIFNTAMSTVRQAVEWGFGKIINEFAFLDFKKNQKLLLQDISPMYSTATILSNCHTCLYGSQSASYFNIEPPTLQNYLGI